jgi:malate synthase
MSLPMTTGSIEVLAPAGDAGARILTLDRRVEITDSVDRKTVINALNSGAQMFMADFENANAPTWRNCVDGRANLIDAVDRTISLDEGVRLNALYDEFVEFLTLPAYERLVANGREAS